MKFITDDILTPSLKLEDYGVFNLTPIERHENILFKRDDLFKPFPDLEISGGKIRQCMALIYNNYNYISRFCNGTVATASSVHSPQGIIVCRVAKEFGFKSILGLGNQKNVEEAKKNHGMVRRAAELGADIRILSKLGYNTALYSKLMEQSHRSKFYIVQFGVSLNNNKEAVIGSIANQVANLPDRLDNLVIPVGSGISMMGILLGIKKFRKKIDSIYGIQIANVSRTKAIDSMVKGINYKFIQDPTYPYAKEVYHTIGDSLTLDPIYEAKAYEYMQNKLNLSGETLFWIVGDSTEIRK